MVAVVVMLFLFYIFTHTGSGGKKKITQKNSCNWGIFVPALNAILMLKAKESRKALK